MAIGVNYKERIRESCISEYLNKRWFYDTMYGNGGFCYLSQWK